jgi:hypothetical protein
VDVQHPDRLLAIDHEQGRDAVLVEQGQRLVDSESGPIVLGFALMKAEAG